MGLCFSSKQSSTPVPAQEQELNQGQAELPKRKSNCVVPGNSPTDADEEEVPDLDYENSSCMTETIVSPQTPMLTAAEQLDEFDQSSLAGILEALDKDFQGDFDPDIKEEMATLRSQFLRFMETQEMRCRYDDLFLCNRATYMPPFSQLLPTVLNQKSGDIDQLLKAAEAHQEWLNTTIILAAELVQAPFRSVAVIKPKESISAKANAEYANDSTRVLDVLRGYIVCRTLENISTVIDWLKRRHDCEVVRVKSAFHINDAIQYFGYRDVKVNLRVAGLICELQLHVEAFFCLYKKQGYELYLWAKQFYIMGFSHPHEYVTSLASSKKRERVRCLVRQALDRIGLPEKSSENFWKLSGDVALLSHALSAANRLTRAIALQAQLVKHAEEKFGSSSAVLDLFLYDTALMLVRQRALDDAALVLRRKLELCENLYGTDHRIVAMSLHSLGLVLKFQNKYDEASEYYKRAIVMARSSLAVDPVRFPSWLRSYAALLQTMGRFEEAEQVWKEALPMLEYNKAASDVDSITCFDLLGLCLYRQGKYQEACTMWEKVQALRGDNFSHDSFSAAQTHYRKALTLMQLRRLDQAEESFELAIETGERNKGSHTVELIIWLHTFGRMLVQKGNLAGGEAKFRQALRINEEVVGIEGASLAEDLDELVECLLQQGKARDAEPECRRAIAIREKHLGADHEKVGSSTLQLVDILRKQRRFGEAAEATRTVISIVEKKHGSEHISLAQPLVTLADMLKQDMQLPEAEALYARVVKLVEQHLSPDDSALALAMGRLATVLQLQKKPDEAIPMFQRALEVGLRTMRPQQREIQVWASQVAAYLLQTEQFQAAEDAFRLLIEIRQTAFGFNHPNVAEANSSLAFVLYRRENYTEAYDVYKQSLKMKVRCFGEEHETVGDCVYGLARVCRMLGRYTEAAQHAERGVRVFREIKGCEMEEARTTYELALAYLSDETRQDEAVSLLQTLVQTAEPLLGKDNVEFADWTQMLATAMVRTEQDMTDVDKLYKKVLRIRERSVGKEDLSVAATLLEQGRYFLAVGRGDAAEKVIARCLSIQRRAGVVGSMEYANALFEMATCLSILGRTMQAHEMAASAQSLFSTLVGDAHSTTQKAQALINAMHGM